MSIKNERPYSVQREFVTNTGQTDYDITGIETGQAHFLYKVDGGIYEYIPSGYYTIVTSGEQITLRITNDRLLESMESIQVAYEVEDDSMTYEPPGATNPEVLKDRYNELVDAFKDFKDYTEKHLLINDSERQTKVMVALKDGEIIAYDETNDQYYGVHKDSFEKIWDLLTFMGDITVQEASEKPIEELRAGYSWRMLDSGTIDRDGNQLDVSENDIISWSQEGYFINLGELQNPDVYDRLDEVEEQIQNLSFDTVEDMVSVSGRLEIDDVVVMSGYYEIGDGGAHKRIIAVSDDGSGIQVGSSWANIVYCGDKINIKSFGATSSDTVSQSIVIQKCMHYCANNNFPMASTNGSFLMAQGDESQNCINIPSGLEWHTDETAYFHAEDDMPAWTRIFSFGNSENVNVYGTIRVDGNRDNQNNSPNEHMHNIFMYNTKDVYIERIHSTNAYADCVSISGGNNLTTYSENITIGAIYGTTAGRKVLVIECCKNLNINTAILDNSLGGYTSIGSNCLDFEPFGIDPEGYKLNAHIGFLSTYGTGDDFTTGTTQERARKFDLDIGEYKVEFMANKPNAQLLTYATNLNIGKLTLVGDNDSDYIGEIISCLYGSYWSIADLHIDLPNSTGNSLVIKTSGGNKPRFSIGNMVTLQKSGLGIDTRGADLYVGKLHIERGLENTSPTIYNQSTSDNNLEFGNIYSLNSSTIEISNYGVGRCKQLYIGSYLVEDYRAEDVGTKSALAVTVGVNSAITLNSWRLPDNYNVITNRPGGTPWFKVSGGAGNITADDNVYLGGAPTGTFYSRGTPEGRIPAGVGSICLRGDGSLGSAFYVKEVGEDENGWVAK